MIRIRPTKNRVEQALEAWQALSHVERKAFSLLAEQIQETSGTMKSATSTISHHFTALSEATINHRVRNRRHCGHGKYD